MSKVSLIGEEYDVDMSIIKMEQVASHLVGLLRHNKISRSELAQKLGWSKGRVTKVLSGDVNLTIKTITTITQKLGYDFEVVFHNKNYEKPKQPWQIDREKAMPTPVIKSRNIEALNVVFQLESGDQVVESVLAGKEKDLYVSISRLDKNLHSSSISVAQQMALNDKSINITYLNHNMKVAYHE
ncbi:DNA-binding helix-turn-helix protein [Acinetobacter calcoaceticus RUH2202]|uniref:helix-turn-helix domain-containing protein n=1 Tax=Acinetobacter calcoaceticus TaxID=471 RepID=UPI0001BB5373|nr:helix-turn-helix domain-containing protein [Acinetobacter calcoaceticus]EEY78937.1 DNA-binding helix-turn-helix protein [Acinetobacter calcoaceticus RUH2202]